MVSITDHQVIQQRGVASLQHAVAMDTTCLKVYAYGAFKDEVVAALWGINMNVQAYNARA